MRRRIGTGLIRLADLLETQWSFPRLGGVLVGIGLGLVIALARIIHTGLFFTTSLWVKLWL